MGTQDIINKQYEENVEKMKSGAEITARYHQKCDQYKKARFDRKVDRERLGMLFSEAKVLGWVLGKTEHTITMDLN